MLWHAYVEYFFFITKFLNGENFSNIRDALLGVSWLWVQVLVAPCIAIGLDYANKKTKNFYHSFAYTS
uniref:Uncharacterized protein n=1 Tax=Rhizophora mucronata TaxID=61149 RepID=A0A2P2P8S7_RHIMU